MRARKWLCFGLPILIGMGMLFASQPKEKRVQPPLPHIDFDYDNTWTGRPLTAGEKTTVGAAINNIKNPPPSSITYKDAAGNTITVACSTLAKNLQAQLDSGDIEAETQNNDVDGGEYQGEINLHERKLAACSTDAGKKYLEELLIHEETHKGSHQDGQTDDENETEARAAELAYKDSIGLDSANSADYRWALSQWKRHYFNYVWGRIQRILEHIWALGYICFIEYGESVAAPDMFKSFAQGDTGFYEYDLDLRASDLMIHEDYSPLGPDHCLALISGGEPMLGHARILGLDIYQGQVQPPDPYILLDFMVPPFYPMFFYSIAYWEGTGSYYLVDTLNQQIVTLPDHDGDLIPDMVVSTYASAFWPGFEPLVGMRSVEPTMHRYYGFGLIVNHEDVHYTDVVKPYDDRFFLPDANGDGIADACIPVNRYEFVTCRPHIIATPWVGDISVQLLATWGHAVEVNATDSLGQPPYEPLGNVWMEMPHMECWLMRPLMLGEYLIAMDMETGTRLDLATKVIDPTPKELTIRVQAGAQLHLIWEAVPGANYYYIYESYDPLDFTGATTYTTHTNEFYLPMMPSVTKLFYRVTAVREGPMQ